MSRHADPTEGLNPQQIAAVTAPPGPALVLAGAGSGKTRTLIHRLAYLIDNGVSPSNLLLLTFTNKAAREMIGRAARLLPHDISQLWAGTFHSVGYRILRRHRSRNNERPLTVLDRDDSEQLIRSSCIEAGVDPKSKFFPKPPLLASILSYAINTRTPVREVLEEKHGDFLDSLDLIARVASIYERKKRDSDTADFDDLLSGTLALLASQPDELRFYRRMFQFILVDEYQDTNALQSDFVDLIAGDAANITAVGDDAQSIYSWRGANYRNILDFRKRHPKAVVYRIETNYRSRPGILKVANAAIKKNRNQFEKTLAPAREEDGSRPIRVALPDPDQQAAFVAEQIGNLIEAGVEQGEIAVLYRAHYQSMEIQMALLRAGLQFDITSGLRFAETAHIKDVSAWLRFASNPRDEASFKRFVKMLPGIGEKTTDTIWNAAQAALAEPAGAEEPAAPLGQRLSGIKVPKKAATEWRQLCHTLDELAPGDPAAAPPPPDAIRIVMEAGYADHLKQTYADAESRLSDIESLSRFSARFETVTEMLAELSLTSEPGEGAERQARRRSRGEERLITLSTIHQAKGLEWSVVFLISLNEGAFPSMRSLDNPDTIEEERRLFYVAVTRARDRLYLTRPLASSGSRGGYGDFYPEASRFLKEIPVSLTENWESAFSPF